MKLFILFALIVFNFELIFSGSSSECFNTIYPGECIAKPESRISCNFDYLLSFDEHNALTISSYGVFTWINLETRGSGKACMNIEGNFTVNNIYSNEAIWSTETSQPGSVAMVTDEGHLVIKGPSGSVLWTSQ